MNIMAVADIIKVLKMERNKLDLAIAALTARGRPGRPRGIAVQSTTPKSRRRLSAAGRKRIADALRARWAEAKKGGKNSL
jgi:hypothetical protein